MTCKLALLFAVLVVCSQAATMNETNATALYNMDDKRFNTLLARLQATNTSEHREYHLMNAFGSFALTCSRLKTLLDVWMDQRQIISAMNVSRNNVIDPSNYNTFLPWFNSNSTNQNIVANLFRAMTPAKVQPGSPPEKFPMPALPYKDQWKQTDLDNLIRNINKVYAADDKIRIAQSALTSSSNLLSSEQALLLYESFSNVADMLSMTEILKERIVGLSCDQVINLLNRFFFDDMKLQALEAFKVDILDVENKLDILDSFRQPKAQALASKILAEVKPRNLIFGNPSGNVLFLIDTSGSMDTNFTLSDGRKMSRLDFVKTEMIKSLNGLDDSSQFNILTYARGISIWRGYGLQKVNKDNIASAIEYTNRLTAYDGTNIHSTLQLAWTFTGVNTIYLLTDGFPNDGVKDVSSIVNDVKVWYAKTPIKINSIAMLMGSDSSDDKPTSKRLMSALADATAGNYRVLESDK